MRYDSTARSRRSSLPRARRRRARSALTVTLGARPLPTMVRLYRLQQSLEFLEVQVLVWLHSRRDLYTAELSWIAAAASACAAMTAACLERQMKSGANAEARSWAGCTGSRIGRTSLPARPRITLPPEKCRGRCTSQRRMPCTARMYDHESLESTPSTAYSHAPLRTSGAWSRS